MPRALPGTRRRSRATSSTTSGAEPPRRLPARRGTGSRVDANAASALELSSPTSTRATTLTALLDCTGGSRPGSVGRGTRRRALRDRARPATTPATSARSRNRVRSSFEHRGRPRACSPPGSPASDLAHEHGAPGRRSRRSPPFQWPPRWAVASRPTTTATPRRSRSTTCRALPPGARPTPDFTPSSTCTVTPMVDFPARQRGHAAQRLHRLRGRRRSPTTLADGARRRLAIPDGEPAMRGAHTAGSYRAGGGRPRTADITLEPCPIPAAPRRHQLRRGGHRGRLQRLALSDDGRESARRAMIAGPRSRCYESAARMADLHRASAVHRGAAPTAPAARASARPSVISSAYSRSAPTGRPLASRVTATSGARSRSMSAR